MTNMRSIFVALVLVIGSLIAPSQSASPSSIRILRLSPALDQLIAPGVEPQALADGYTEEP